MAIFNNNQPKLRGLNEHGCSGIKYMAPNVNVGLGQIQAWDTIRGAKLWERIIFLDRFDAFYEDQDNFIIAIEIENARLVVTDRRGGEYYLDRESGKTLEPISNVVIVTAYVGVSCAAIVVFMFLRRWNHGRTRRQPL